jgi:hypothetical protein
VYLYVVAVLLLHKGNAAGVPVQMLVRVQSHQPLLGAA